MPHVFTLSAPFLGAAALGKPARAPHVFVDDWGAGTGAGRAGPPWWAQPCACSPNLDPVIGKDGVVYKNTCTAACRGVEVRGPAGGFSGAFGGLGDAGTETVRVIGLGVIGLALGYGAAYLLFFRR